MTYQEDRHAARAAELEELEERAESTMCTLRQELRERLGISGLRITKVSKDLGHSSTYLSSVLARTPRTDLRLKTFLMLLEVLRVPPESFFREIFSKRRDEDERMERMLSKWLERYKAMAPHQEQPTSEPLAAPSHEELTRVVDEIAESLLKLRTEPEAHDDAEAKAS